MVGLHVISFGTISSERLVKSASQQALELYSQLLHDPAEAARLAPCPILAGADQLNRLALLRSEDTLQTASACGSPGAATERGNR